MKVSKFNIINIRSQVEGIAYNSYTGALAKVDENFMYLLDYIAEGKNITKLSSDKKEILYKMQKAGFVINESINELERLQNLRQIQKQNKKILKIVVAPTLECNFACKYCYEVPKKGEMVKNIQDKLILFIQEKLKQDKVEKLSLVWYGGEPLLAKHIIYEISNRLIELCKEYNVQYSSSIITNGYLIDNETADKLYKSNIKFAQITVDGLKDIHDRRRPLKALNENKTYDKIIENINILNKKGINVSIRVNIDINNYETIEKFIDQISKEISDKDKTSIYLGHVFEHADGKKCYNKYCLSKEQFSSCKLISLKSCKEYGFARTIRKSYPRLRPNYCAATLDNSFVIDYDGNIYKCWNDVCDTNYKVGKVGNTIEFNDNITKWNKYNAIDDEKCRECSILPICAGGCPRESVYFQKQNKCEDIKFIIKDLMEFYAKLNKNN